MRFIPFAKTISPHPKGKRSFPLKNTTGIDTITLYLPDLFPSCVEPAKAKGIEPSARRRPPRKQAACRLNEKS